MTKRFMYLSDPRLDFVNGMLQQPKLFIGPEAYDAAKSLAFTKLYGADATTMARMYGSNRGVKAGELSSIGSGSGGKFTVAEGIGKCFFGRCSCTIGVCRGLGQHKNRW
jgi:hypothetical protein